MDSKKTNYPRQPDASANGRKFKMILDYFETKKAGKL